MEEIKKLYLLSSGTMNTREDDQVHGIFDSIKKAEEIILKNYPKAKKDENGGWEVYKGQTIFFDIDEYNLNEDYTEIYD